MPTGRPGAPAAGVTRRVAVGDVSLAVHEWPAGARTARPVVAVHGLTANHTCWAAIADGLGPRYRLIAYDLRGRGDSDKPATGYSLEAHCRDLEGLLDRLALRRVALMGHSLGAHIALRFAVTRPRRVDRLVLVDGGLDLRPEVQDSLAPVIGRLGVEFPSFDALRDTMRTRPMFEGRWNDYLERYFRYDAETLPSGAVRAKAARHAVLEELASLRRERLWVLHHQVRRPTLVLRAPDGLLTATDCLMTAEEGRAMATAIPRARLVTVPGTNHYTIVLARQPRVTAALRAFLGGR